MASLKSRGTLPSLQICFRTLMNQIIVAPTPDRRSERFLFWRLFVSCVQNWSLLYMVQDWAISNKWLYRLLFKVRFPRWSMSDCSASMVVLSATSRGQFCEDEGPYALVLQIQLSAILHIVNVVHSLLNIMYACLKGQFDFFCATLYTRDNAALQMQIVTVFINLSTDKKEKKQNRQYSYNHWSKIRAACTFKRHNGRKHY